MYPDMSYYFPLRNSSWLPAAIPAISCGPVFGGTGYSLSRSTEKSCPPGAVTDTRPGVFFAFPNALRATRFGMPMNLARRVDATAYWDAASFWSCGLKNTVLLLHAPPSSVGAFGFNAARLTSLRDLAGAL